MSSEAIHSIIKDYQCDYEGRKFELSPEHIQKWANQFGEDADFVLSELLHFLPEVYISKDMAREMLRKRLVGFQEFHKYSSMNEFILKTHFFDLQIPEKSQSELLIMIDDILQSEYMINYKEHLNEPKKHYIYFDDVLATGGTIIRDLEVWLNEGNNTADIIDKSKTLAISLFCYHKLGYTNFEYRLMKCSDDKIKKLLIVGNDYVIENDLKTKWEAQSQRLNCAYPIENQSKEVMDYFNSLNTEYDKIPAFRDKNLPKKETFFSSPENRIKLENLFLNKGVELLGKIKKDNPDPRKRPLGDTLKSHKTFGTGTLFFTWRNISNTCPLVFWWDVPGHDWIPLFCLKNRGN
jgi:hypothetical protein